MATWAAPQQRADAAQSEPTGGFPDTTLRQVLRVSLGGSRLRVRFSNAFGATPLTLARARLALSAGGSAVMAGSDRALAFAGRPSVVIRPGATVETDAVAFELPPLAEVAVSVYLRGAPAELTAHPGSRTTSYLQTGDAVSAADLGTAARVDHWYFLSGIDVLAKDAAAIAVLGDSITDGRGTTTNGNDRWTDRLAERLQASPKTAHLGVINAGMGGNRLLNEGLGPSGLARLDRDVLAQPGVRFLIVLIGTNDLGTAKAAGAEGKPGTSAVDLIGGYEQVVKRAHARGLRVYGGTLPPFEGSAYFDAATEAARQSVNAWIRTSGAVDAVVDFDAVMRDPHQPSRLREDAGSADHLHPGPAGYRLMGDAVELSLFASRP